VVTTTWGHEAVKVLPQHQGGVPVEPEGAEEEGKGGPVGGGAGGRQERARAKRGLSLAAAQWPPTSAATKATCPRYTTPQIPGHAYCELSVVR